VKVKYTTSDFRKQFKDDDSCLEFLFLEYHGDTQECPKCKAPFKYYRIKNRRCYCCKQSGCGHQIYPTKGTIFERSTIPLTDWFSMMFEFHKSKNGISAKEIERKLGVSNKTALRMGHQIRKAMKEDIGQLKGIVEMDESQIGGKKNRNKFYIFGMFERKGRAKVYIVNDRPKGKELIPIIKKNVKPGTKTFTDKYGGYSKLKEAGYKHRSISHKSTYSERGVSTNYAEGFWSLFKRSILGTHVHVSRKWLQSYLDEITYRYNRRNKEEHFLDFLLRAKIQT
jgi:transposase